MFHDAVYVIKNYMNRGYLYCEYYLMKRAYTELYFMNSEIYKQKMIGMLLIARYASYSNKDEYIYILFHS